MRDSSRAVKLRSALATVVATDLPKLRFDPLEDYGVRVVRSTGFE
jgi:hypothetical protein